MEKGRDNKKKEIKGKYLSVLIVLMTLLFFTVMFLVVNKMVGKNDLNNSVNKNDNHKYLSASEVWDFAFECSISQENSSGDIDVFGVNDDVYCNINQGKIETLVDTYNYNGDYFEFKFKENKNIELIDVYSLNDYWNVKKENNKIILELQDDINVSNKDILADFYIKFHINNNEGVSDKYNIILSNFIYVSNGLFYEVDNGISLDLNTSNTRVVKLDSSEIKFEEINSKGEFVTASSYKCNDSDCFVDWVIEQGFQYDNSDDNIKMIFDGDNKILYNIKTGIINKYGKNALWLCEAGNKNYGCSSSGKYIYIQENGTDKYGIIDPNGNIIKKFSLEKYSYVDFYNPLSLRYSIEDNMLVDVKNNKYGIIEITSDKIIVDYLYDDIELINNKYFKAKQNNKWYYYDISTNKKIIDEGFDNFVYVSDEILVALNNKILYIKDKNNNNITKIENVFESSFYSISVDTSTDVYKIFIGNKESHPELYSIYEYNSSNKTLTLESYTENK